MLWVAMANIGWTTFYDLICYWNAVRIVIQPLYSAWRVLCIYHARSWSVVIVSLYIYIYIYIHIYIYIMGITTCVSSSYTQITNICRVECVACSPLACTHTYTHTHTHTHKQTHTHTQTYTHTQTHTQTHTHSVDDLMHGIRGYRIRQTFENVHRSRLSACVYVTHSYL